MKIVFLFLYYFFLPSKELSKMNIFVQASALTLSIHLYQAMSSSMYLKRTQDNKIALQTTEQFMINMKEIIFLFFIFITGSCHSLKSCYMENASWNNTSILDILIPVSDALQCHYLCRDQDNCVAWTWTTPDNSNFNQESCAALACKV